MLSEDERREIEEAAGRFPVRRAAAIEALQTVQLRRGWVSDEALAEAAGLLGMTVDELDGVASFYSLVFRKPVGRHVILVCDSITCWIEGYEKILERLTARLGVGLGGTDAEGRFTLLPVACLGACDHAPAMLVDGDLHGGLTPEAIDDILERYK
ncbi:MAG TPA: NADH-quinone oxidoreductase subunit NuoE [Candidatus Bathyarchaeia archaeon]|nr:NADH-quinone oxidoreductase subunit NuoE [Candidatus Bathyarchaeia archaeon]